MSVPLAAPPDLAALRSAAAALAGVAERTPLLPLPALAGRLGVPVLLKAEFRQPIGAFKVRGAWTAATRLPEAARARGLLTHSSGNHGQAIAFAARRLGVRAVVVMPDDSPRVKVEGVRRHGGEVVFCARAERARVAAELERREGLAFIPPYEHPDVILGQGTVGLEILDDCPEVALLLVPTGGGGLLAGVSAAVRATRAAVRVVGVEPAGAAKLSAAFATGAPATLARAESLADGLLPLAIGTLPWAIIREVVSDAVTVPDAEIAEAVRWLHAEAGLRVEPSGAIAVAALLAGRVRADGPVVAVATGGNVDDDVFDRLVHA